MRDLAWAARSKSRSDGNWMWPGEFQITSARWSAAGVSMSASNIRQCPRRGAASERCVPLMRKGVHAVTWGSADSSQRHCRGHAMSGRRGRPQRRSADWFFLPNGLAEPGSGAASGPGKQPSMPIPCRVRPKRRTGLGVPDRHHESGITNLRQPTLGASDAGAGMQRTVVIQTTKQGLVFVLDRDTANRYVGRGATASERGCGGDARLAPRHSRFATHVPERWPQRFSNPDVLNPFLDRHDARRARTQIGSCGHMKASTAALDRPPKERCFFTMTGGGVNWGAWSFGSRDIRILQPTTSHAVQSSNDPESGGGRFQASARAMILADARRPLRDARGWRSAVGLLCKTGRVEGEMLRSMKAARFSGDHRSVTSEDRATLGIASNGHAAGQRRVITEAAGLPARWMRNCARSTPNRRSNLEGRVAGPRCRQSHDLSLEGGEPICGDRAGGPFRKGHVDRTTAWWLFACRGRAKHPRVVAHGRPARAGGS